LAYYQGQLSEPGVNPENSRRTACPCRGKRYEFKFKQGTGRRLRIVHGWLGEIGVTLSVAEMVVTYPGVNTDAKAEMGVSRLRQRRIYRWTITLPLYIFTDSKNERSTTLPGKGILRAHAGRFSRQLSTWKKLME
jgi:hypothetical protein